MTVDGFELRARAATARLALARAELRFDPNQPRGADGRWIRGGAGAPSAPATPDIPVQRGAKKAAPAKKTAAKKAPARTRGVDSWLADLGKDDVSPETREQITRAFSYTDPQTGWRSEVDGITPSNTTIRIRVNILDEEGRKIGRAIRNIWPGRRGSAPNIYHSAFELDKSKQGNGFSSRWLTQMEDRYREQGIGAIQLTTDDIGGYAWAKAGFDFLGPSEARIIANKFKAALKKKSNQLELSQRTLTDGAELVRRAHSDDRSEWPTPMEFAMLGWTPGAKDWIGKRTLIGTNWAAEKTL